MLLQQTMFFILLLLQAFQHLFDDALNTKLDISSDKQECAGSVKNTYKCCSRSKEYHYTEEFYL